MIVRISSYYNSSTIIAIITMFIVLFIFDLGIYAGWAAATVYVLSLGFVFMFRFLNGKWKSMRVIEEAPVAIPPCMPEGLKCQD